MESLSAVVLDMSMPKGGYGPLGSSSSASTSESSSRFKRESLTRVQMMMLNAVVCGVEICACAGFTYIPPMLLKVGFSEENMGFLLGLGPLLGFLLVPIIGRASDRCYSQFGRRRPFILGLSVLLVVSLYLIPFGEYFGSLMVGVSSTSKSIGVWALTVGVVLLDFTTQACLTPIEAMLNDVTKDSDQNERIFTIYSFMISMGGIFGYLLTAIDWTSNPLGQYFGGQEASIFSILILIFTMLLAATLMVAQEAPLSPPPTTLVDVSTVGGTTSNSTSNPASVLQTRTPLNNESEYESTNNSSENDAAAASKSFLHSDSSNGRTRVLLRKNNSWSLVFRDSRRVFYKLLNYLPFGGQFIKSATECFGWLCRQLLPNQLAQLFQIPIVLKYLALADFFSWTAIMAFNIYFTDYVGQIVYGGNPNAQETSPEGRAYDEGVRTASWGLLLHCICSACFSFFIERLTASYGYRMTFTLGMLTFVLAMMGMVLIRHILFVNLMAAVTGFAYATLTTIPFMLVSKYHDNKKIYFFDLPPVMWSDSERGIGADMAVLDWSYFLSQVILTVTMGAIVHVTGTLISYMVTAGTMGILAIYCIGKVVENEAEARRCINGR